jgi:hypothetical protein
LALPGNLFLTTKQRSKKRRRKKKEKQVEIVCSSFTVFQTWYIAIRLDFFSVQVFGYFPNIFGNKICVT